MRGYVYKFSLMLACIVVLCVMSAFAITRMPYTTTRADTIPEIVAEDVTIHRGQTFEVDVDLSSNGGLISLMLILNYDSDALKLVNVKRGDALSSLTMTTTSTTTSQGYAVQPFNILWDGRETDTSNGTLVTLVFDSYFDAPVGDYEISLDYDRDNTKKAYLTPTDVDISSSTVTFQTGEYTAVYRNYDGTVLYAHDFTADQVPEYIGDVPTRPTDTKYSYTFSKWVGAVAPDLSTLVFDAYYDKTAIIYTIVFYVDGLNGEPDGVITEDDFYKAESHAYNEYLDMVIPPAKRNYVFVGWFIDANFATPYYLNTMPDHNLRLYGYYKFDIREHDIPEMVFSNTVEDEEVTVLVEMTKNTGINSMVLTISYDLTKLRLVSFERQTALSTMQFDTTDIAYIDRPNFKFYYESNENVYDVGVFLKLNFVVREGASEGLYDVTFNYDYHTDATYKTNAGDIKYTMLDITKTQVSIGEINHWEKQVAPDRKVDVVSAEGKPLNTTMDIDLVTSSVEISQESIDNISEGRKMYVLSVYSIKMLQDDVEVQPDTTLLIRITLTKNEQLSSVYKVCYINELNELVPVTSVVSGEVISFTTDHLSNWVILGNHDASSSLDETKIMILILLPILLSFATLGYALLMKRKYNHARQNQIEGGSK